MAREPWDKANIERFRRALVLLGEPDPDALIAARLSGESPFMSTDLSGGSLFDELAARAGAGARPTRRSTSCWPRRPPPTSRSKKAAARSRRRGAATRIIISR